MNKKQKWLYLFSVFVFLASSFSFAPIFAQTATLSVSLNTLNIFGEIIYGGSAPLTGVAMTSTVSGTATGTMNYYFYCNAPNDSSTEVVSGYAHSIIGTNSTTVTTPNGICDSVYANIGTYLAKVIVQRGGIAAEERRTLTVSNPLPQLNLQIRPLGASDWLNPDYDWIINIPYNSAAEIRWTFSGADYCTMSGDWSGTKTEPGQESTGNLTESKTYIYTLECNTSSGRLTDTVMASVAPPTLFGSFSASPNSGPAPLSGAILTANITGGTAVGTINYTFYCNRSDTGINITSGYAYKLDGTNLLTVPTPNDACNSVYANVGNYTAKVIIERGGIAVEYRASITVTAPPPPSVNLTADSSSIPHNSSTTLRWTVSNATNCTPSAGPVAWTSSGNKTLALGNLPTGSWSTGNLTGPANYNYTLTCTGPGGTGSDSVTVGVGAPPPPPGVDLNADSTIIVDGASTMLRWTISNATSGDTTCTGSGPANWIGSKTVPTGSQSTGNLAGPNSYTYTLACTGPGGTNSDSVTITVGSPPPPYVELWVEDIYKTITVPHGTSVFLNWNTGDPEPISCEGYSVPPGNWSDGPKNPGGGWDYTGSLVGSTDPLVLNQYTFTITCYNSAGVSRSSSVVVNVYPDYGEIGPPEVNLEVRPVNGVWDTDGVNIDYNAEAELRWTVENVVAGTVCEASGDWSGSPSVAGGLYRTGRLSSGKSYTITCTGPGGSNPDTVYVGVRLAPTPTVNIEASQNMVDYGGSVRLNWSSLNATPPCEASSYSGKWSGSRMLSGSEVVYNLTQDDTFTLTCVGEGGAGWQSVSVDVGSPPPVELELTVKRTTETEYRSGSIEVDCNNAVDLRWEVSGAINCRSWGDWGVEGPVSSTGGTYRTQNLTQGNYTYTIFCENAAGSYREDTVYVTVRECPENLPIIFENPINQGDFRNVLNSLSGLIRMIAIALAAIMIIISGIIILTSIDDRERLNKGKNMLKWALIGLAIALASSFIIGFIEELIN